MEQKETTVGRINERVLAFTAGRDHVLDRALIAVDCLGTAAHVDMLAAIKTPVLTAEERDRVIAVLIEIMRRDAAGEFEITLQDQDVHLAVERFLTEQCGDLGKKVHTARSRNDQVALDLRLYTREKLLDTMDLVLVLAEQFVVWGRKHQDIPMVGRTHMQPAMPSSVGLWATAFAEELLEDIDIMEAAFRMCDRCPLGSAAGYGVPLEIDRRRTSEALAFREPIHNVLYANNARGKLESVVLNSMAQVMLTLSRLAQDLIIFMMPEFAYFRMPAEYGTGSSIMPQKNNPDVLELIRAKAARVHGHANTVFEIVRAAPTGYNRDLQEAKEPLMQGIEITIESLGVLPDMIRDLTVDREACIRAFIPGVFAADRVLERVAAGEPFRDAYNYVKEHLAELENADPAAAVSAKKHLGAPGGLGFEAMLGECRAGRQSVQSRRHRIHQAFSRLMGVNWPLTD